MARMAYSGPFLDELAALPARDEGEVWAKLALVESFPGVGSSLVGPSLARAFGPGCLKISAAGLDIVYERCGGEGDDELVRVHGVVAQRRVR